MSYRPSSLPPNADRRIRILIVDDHAVVRSNLSQALNLEPDLTVIGEAENGLRAIQAADTLRPDIIIMDLAMPEMNGIEATARIRSAQPGMKIIGLSITTNAAQAAAMREAGACAFLAKGASMDDIVRTIRIAAKPDTPTPN